MYLKTVIVISAPERLASATRWSAHLRPAPLRPIATHPMIRPALDRLRIRPARLKPLTHLRPPLAYLRPPASRLFSEVYPAPPTSTVVRRALGPQWSQVRTEARIRRRFEAQTVTAPPHKTA